MNDAQAAAFMRHTIADAYDKVSAITFLAFSESKSSVSYLIMMVKMIRWNIIGCITEALAPSRLIESKVSVTDTERHTEKTTVNYAHHMMRLLGLNYLFLCSGPLDSMTLFSTCKTPYPSEEEGDFLIYSHGQPV